METNTYMKNWRLPENILKRRSVIITVYDNSHIKTVHKLRAVNPHFPIIRDIGLLIPDKYYFNGALRIYDPYDDEERFLRTINNFVRVCSISRYFFIDDDRNMWEVIPEADKKTPVTDMQIIENRATAVGNIMVLALCAVVHANPAIKDIIDIGYKR